MSIYSKLYNKLTNSKIDNKNAIKDRKERVREVDKELFYLKAEETREREQALRNEIQLLKTERNTQRIKEVPIKKASMFKRYRKVSEIISSLTSICGISIYFNLVDLKILFSEYWAYYLLKGGALGNILGLLILGIIFNRGISFTYALLEENTTLNGNFYNYLKKHRYIFISAMVLASITTNFIFWYTLLNNIIMAALYSIMYDLICVLSTLFYSKYYYMQDMDLEDKPQAENNVYLLEQKQDENTEKNIEKNTNEKLNENIIDTSNCNNLSLDFFTEKIDEKEDEKEDPKLDPKDTVAAEEKPGKPGKKGGRKIDKRTREKLTKAIEELAPDSIITKKSLGYKGNVSILKSLCEELAKNGKLVYFKVGKDNKRRYYKKA